MLEIEASQSGDLSEAEWRLKRGREVTEAGQARD